MRRGILLGIYTRVYTTRVIYMGQLLVMEASYTDKSQYSLAGKCILTNYVILSVTLYFVGNKVQCYEG